MYRSLIFLYVCISSTATVSASEGGGCNICGNGMVVSKSDAAAPGYAEATCGQLQAAAEAGAIENCGVSLTDTVFAACGCMTDPLDGASSSLAACNICGEDHVVTEPDAAGFLPEHPEVTCGQFQQAAESEGLSPATCNLLPDLLYSHCGCMLDPILSTTTDSQQQGTTQNNGDLATEGILLGNPSPNNDGDLTTEGIPLEDPSSNNDGDLATEGIPFGNPSSNNATGTSPTPTACNICGDEHVVSKPDTVAPGYTSTTCGQLQAATEAGAVASCGAALTNVVSEACGCTNDPSASHPLAACDICGDGHVVTNANAAGFLPEHPEVTCGQFQHTSETVGLSPATCDLLPTLLYSDCGCMVDPRFRTTQPEVTTQNDGELPEEGILVPPSTAQNDGELPEEGILVPSRTTCNICGSGNVVSKPDVAAPGYAEATCGLLQAAAEAGAVANCGAALTNVVSEACGCTSDPAASQPLAACDICGDGHVVTKANAAGFLPEHQEITCGQFQQTSETVGLSPATCDLLPTLLYSDCGCMVDPRFRTSQPEVTTQNNDDSGELPEEGIIINHGDNKTPVQQPNDDGELVQEGIPLGESNQGDNSSDDLEDEGIPLFEPPKSSETNDSSSDDAPPPAVSPTGVTAEEGIKIGDIEDPNSPIAAAPYICSVCGQGMTVTKPHTLLSFPADDDFGGRITSCKNLQRDGHDGIFPEGYCDGLPDVVHKACACEPSPVNVAAVTTPSSSSSSSEDTPSSEESSNVESSDDARRKRGESSSSSVDTDPVEESDKKQEGNFIEETVEDEDDFRAYAAAKKGKKKNTKKGGKKGGNGDKRYGPKRSGQKGGKKGGKKGKSKNKNIHEDTKTDYFNDKLTDSAPNVSVLGGRSSSDSSSLSSCSMIAAGRCSICGAGSCITKEDATVDVLGSVQTCASLQQYAGKNYYDDDNDCHQAKQSVHNQRHCRCSMPESRRRGLLRGNF